MYIKVDKRNGIPRNDTIPSGPNRLHH